MYTQTKQAQTKDAISIISLLIALTLGYFMNNLVESEFFEGFARAEEQVHHSFSEDAPIISKVSYPTFPKSLNES